MTCRKCNRDLAGKTVYREVTGYTRHRAQGGTNHLLHPQPTGNYLCQACIHVAEPQQQQALGL